MATTAAHEAPSALTSAAPATAAAAVAAAHDTVIEARSGWRLLDVAELVHYRDLLYFLVRRDVKVLYTQTVLGFGWAIIRPVFSMLVFTVVFGGLAGIPSDGAPYALFAFAALLPWTYYATAMQNATSSLVNNAGMLTKVYFPRVVIPLTPVLAGLVDFAVAAVVLAVLMAFYGVVPPLAVLSLPLLVALMVLSAVGAGLWLSALTVQYRDVRHAMTFVVQLMMYAAPVVWPASLLAERFPVWGPTLRLAYGLYPIVGVIEGFRAALLGTTPMPWDLIGIGAASAAVIAVTGAVYFRRTERLFADLA